MKKRSFVPASELNPGDTFLTREGKHEIRASTRIEHAPADEIFNTYNFEVEDFHTYFVGESGVWVHNTGKAPCERVFSIFESFKRRNGGDAAAA